MKIDYRITPADRIDCPLVVLGMFLDERLLTYGAIGQIDWRLNGFLSIMVRNHQFLGEWKEKALVPSQTRLHANKVLLFGLGVREDFKSEREKMFFEEIIHCANGLNAQSIAIAIDNLNSSIEKTKSNFQTLFEEKKFSTHMILFSTQQKYIKPKGISI